MLLTFGMAFPPLAIFITVYICTSSMLLQYIIQNHCKDSKLCVINTPNIDNPDSYYYYYLPLVYQIAKECQGFTGVLFYTCLLMTIDSFIFFGVFMVDITANSLYFLNSCIWAFVLLVFAIVAKKYYYDVHIG